MILPLEGTLCQLTAEDIETRKRKSKKNRLFLTTRFLVGLQKAVDEKVHCADGVICPLSQTPDEMLQILLQVGMQKCTRVRAFWLDDGRHRLQEEPGLITDQTEHASAEAGSWHSNCVTR